MANFGRSEDLAIRDKIQVSSNLYRQYPSFPHDKERGELKCNLYGMASRTILGMQNLQNKAGATLY